MMKVQGLSGAVDDELKSRGSKLRVLLPRRKKINKRERFKEGALNKGGQGLRGDE